MKLRANIGVFVSIFLCQTAVSAVLRVTDFGADPTGARPSQAGIAKACAAAKDGDVVVIPTGVYAFSGNVTIERKNRLTVRGEPGAVIRMHSNPEGPERECSGAFCIKDCRDFRVESLTVTTDNPIGCAGRITGTDAAAGTVDFRVDAACPFTGREHFFQINSCDEEGAPDRALQAHANIHAVTNEAGEVRHVGMPYVVLGDRHVRLSVPKWESVQSVTNGHRALIRYSREFGTPFWVAQVRGACFQNVEIARTPAMGVVLSTGTSDVTFRRFNLRPAADDPALHASNADGIHVFGCAGCIRLEDCRFKGLGDDAFNVHSMGGEIVACDARKGTATFVLRSVDRKPLPLPARWAVDGDELEVYDQKTFRRRGNVRLKSYKDGQATFAPVKFAVGVGDIVVNARHQPAVRIEGCSFENTRARALLLQTHHLSVENSFFRGFPSPAILVGSDLKTWNEMAPTVDAEIRGCTFEKCARAVRHPALAAVVARLNHGVDPSDYPPGALANVSVCENRFSDIGTAAVYVECTENVRICDNEFKGTWKDAGAAATNADVRLNRCTEVRLTGNRTERDASRLVSGWDNSPRLAEIFTDHMVLQAGKPVRVFGYGDGRVTVSFRGHAATAVAQLGKWSVELPAMEAGGPYEMAVDLGGRRQVLKDVMLGEVLVMAGQSNMQFMLCESTTKERFEDPNIRLFATTRLEVRDRISATNGWVALEKNTCWAWSAIGCETAVRLARATGRAVGVIHCFQGASFIKAWMPRELANEARFALPPEKCGHHDRREHYYSFWNRSGRLYERQFSVFAGYPVASVSWYQGESNSGSVEEGELYAAMLTAMVGRWRKDLLDDKLPFYVLQLAADTTGGRNHAAWNAVKASQAKVAATVPGVTLVRTDDICEPDKGIHPPTKRLIAERLSSCMLRNMRGDAAEWPALKSYEGEFLSRIKMPIGGIGTGTVSLSGRGALVDWEMRNNAAKDVTPQDAVSPAFLIRTETADGKVSMRILEGPADVRFYEGATGAWMPNHGFPRFRNCVFEAAYPLARVRLSDRAMPVAATLEAMNPLVPGDEEASGLPAALLRWRVRNVSSGPVKVSVCGILVGHAGGEIVRESADDGEVRAVRIGSRDVTPADDTLGELVLAVRTAGSVTRATRIANVGWMAGFDGFVRQFVATGEARDVLDPEAAGKMRSVVAMSAAVSVPAGGESAIPFVLAWRYPHRRAWKPGFPVWSGPFPADQDVGNHYAEVYPTALAAAGRFFENLAQNEAKTVSFVRKVLATQAPDVVKEAALFNLSTLRTETCFRTADGHFYGWEGVMDLGGSCFGNCTHVWGYEHALVDLWPNLAKDMTETQYGPAMATNGMMAFRVRLPADRSKPGSAMGSAAAADGQMQCIVKAYENWKKTGDDAWLRGLYPRIRKSLEYAWLPNGWDGDRDGVMEGCQHNTMDVDYYGPNPQMEFLYLAALKAMAAMADFCGEPDFAADCRKLAERGSAWTEKNLFNGDYYEHRVRVMKGTPAAGTCTGTSKNASEPDYQLAAGCLVDQLVGDYASRHAGLGPVADEAHALKTLETILRRNRSDPETSQFNNMRDFALPDEPALKMAWYPPGRMPKKPFPYYVENMTGFEYVVAANLAQRGDFARAEQVVRDIRSRYNGRKRNPFDEAECGHHYARALAAWSVLKAFEPLAGAKFSRDSYWVDKTLMNKKLID